MAGYRPRIEPLKNPRKTSHITLSGLNKDDKVKICSDIGGIQYYSWHDDEGKITEISCNWPTYIEITEASPPSS